MKLFSKFPTKMILDIVKKETGSTRREMREALPDILDCVKRDEPVHRSWIRHMGRLRMLEQDSKGRTREKGK